MGEGPAVVMYATRKEHRITGLSLWGAAAVLIPKVSNFEQQFPFHSFRKRRLFASEDGGSRVARYCERSPQRIRGPCRTLPENGEDCIEPAARVIQRQWAVEWLKLADAVRRPRRFKQMQMG